MAQNMSIGKLGSSNLIIKRQFRWTFDISGIKAGGQSTVPEYFVKLASRPNLTVEETELNFLNEKTWIPGKAAWETITVTYIDVATKDNQPLWNWLASVYNFSGSSSNGGSNNSYATQGSQPGDYEGTGNLRMWDGCGTLLEKWTLKRMWPTSVNFGELDYSSSEAATIELTLRYSGVEYQSMCPAFTPVGKCTPCS